MSFAQIAVALLREERDDIERAIEKLERLLKCKPSERVLAVRDCERVRSRRLGHGRCQHPSTGRGGRW